MQMNEFVLDEPAHVDERACSRGFQRCLWDQSKHFDTMKKNRLVLINIAHVDERVCS